MTSKNYATGGRNWRQEKRQRKWCKDRLLRESFNYCGYCGRKENPRKLTLDHIVPVSKGGLTELKNLVLCCLSCNQIKSNMMPGQWLEHLDREDENKKKQPINQLQEIFLI